MSESTDQAAGFAALSDSRLEFQISSDKLTLLSEDDVADLEAALGHSFSNRELLERRVDARVRRANAAGIERAA